VDLFPRQNPCRDTEKRTASDDGTDVAHLCGTAGALTTITAAVVGVVLNLAVWFALHTLFADVREVRTAGMRIDVPVWSSVNVPALLLTAAALIAVFRFKAGPMPVIAGCAVAGMAYWLALS